MYRLKCHQKKGKPVFYLDINNPNKKVLFNLVRQEAFFYVKQDYKSYDGFDFYIEKSKGRDSKNLGSESLHNYDLKFNRDIKFIRIFTYFYFLIINYEIMKKRKTKPEKFFVDAAIPYSWYHYYGSYNHNRDMKQYPIPLRERTYVNIILRKVDETFRREYVFTSLKIKHISESFDEFLNEAHKFLSKKRNLNPEKLSLLLRKMYDKGKGLK